MALTARHRWCMSKLVEAFGPDVDSSKSQVGDDDDGGIDIFRLLMRLHVYYTYEYILVREHYEYVRVLNPRVTLCCNCTTIVLVLVEYVLVLVEYE